MPTTFQQDLARNQPNEFVALDTVEYTAGQLSPLRKGEDRYASGECAGLAPQSIQEARLRLLKLANHLEGQRGHAHFNFAMVSWQPGNCDTCHPEHTACGTAGCAVGELPYCWPETFRFVKTSSGTLGVSFIQAPGVNSFVAAAIWFGLDHWETNHLFIPMNQIPRQYSGYILGDSATVLQVVRNIRDFVKARWVEVGAKQLWG